MLMQGHIYEPRLMKMTAHSIYSTQPRSQLICIQTWSEPASRLDIFPPYFYPDVFHCTVMSTSQ